MIKSLRMRTLRCLPTLSLLPPQIKMLKKHWPVLVLFFFIGLVILLNISPSTFLIGWDNLLPEFNIFLNIKRSIFSVWQNEALGFITGNANAADLPRQIMLLPLTALLPLNLVRQVYIFLQLFIGVSGTYFLIKSLIRYKDPILNLIIPLIGALFYLFNLATIQTFYAPFEPFITHYAFLPWLLFSALLLIANKSRKSILTFIIVNILAIPQSQVPTIFFVYLFSLCFFLLVIILETRRREILLSSIKIILFTLIINSFWLLPFLYFVFSNSNVTFLAKINQMGTQTVFLQNKEYGDLGDVILLKGFWFNNVDLNTKGHFELMLAPWRQHLSGWVSTIGYLLFSIILIGFVLVKRSKPFIMPFSALLVLAITMLATNTPPFSWIDYVFRQIPLFNEVFRFPFTKFSILAALTYSFFFSIGTGSIITFLSNRFRTKGVNLLMPLLVILILIYMFPIFRGKLFYERERINLLPDYGKLFKYFSIISPTERVANFPAQTLWGWNYYKWGYGGSGFLWYELPQPVLDRAFDVWSRQSENYYWEISYALYTKNPALFEKVLKKYNVSYLILDKNVMSVDSESSLYVTELQEILRNLADIKKDKSFGKIEVYKLPQISSLKIANAKVNGYDWGNLDKAYLDFGDYISTDKNEEIVYPFRSLFSNKNESDKEFKAEIKENTIKFISKETNQEFEIPKAGISFNLHGKAKNCDNFRHGSFYSKEINNYMEFYSKNSTACFFTNIGPLSPNQGYLLTIDNKNLKGRPIHVWLVSENGAYAPLDTYLSANRNWTTSYFVIPPLDGQNMAFTLHLDNVSINDEALNQTGKISLYSIPYETLTSMITYIKKPSSLAVLDGNQAFDKGWKAYYVKDNSFFNQYFPFLFGREIKRHVLLNNWDNGWILNNETAPNERIVTVYLPQYFEHLGFLALGGLIFYFLIGNINRIFKKTAGSLLGKGIIDKFFPFLIPILEKIYLLAVKDGLKMVKTPFGTLRTSTKDTSISLSLLLKNEYEPKETEMIKENLKEGDYFFDIGANIGYYSVLASKIVGKTGKVFAFEPDPENFNKLSENIKLNGCENVILENKAVADHSGKLNFISERFRKGESRISADGKTKVETITLDNYVKNLKIDCIKMDIEGAEILALKGALKSLKRRGIKLFVEYNPQSLKKFTKDSLELIDIIEKNGFKIISIIDESRKETLPYSRTNLESLMRRVTFCNLYCES